MKIVKNLSLANIRGTDFIRRPDLDFTDDGNRFRGFSYKGIPITTLYEKGSVYCSVRTDLIQTNNSWIKKEGLRLGEKYNGTDEKIDMDDLADICEQILSRMEK